MRARLTADGLGFLEASASLISELNKPHDGQRTLDRWTLFSPPRWCVPSTGNRWRRRAAFQFGVEVECEMDVTVAKITDADRYHPC